MHMAEASAVRIDRKSSIETEPRTLKMNQIQYAREAALYVVSHATIEEALRIFTEGLEPVECKTTPDRETMVGWNDEEDEEEEDELYPFKAHGIQELRSLHRFRDIVSAPF